MRRESDMDAWALFCRCAELGSIRRACAELGEEPSSATRLLHALETATGVELFDRSRKPAALTAAGVRAFRAMAPLVAAHRRAIAVIRTDPREAGGKITFASPAGFGSEVLPGLFLEFQAEHPEIELFWTEISPEIIRAAAAGAPEAPDLLFAYAPLAMEGAVIDRTCRMEFVPCASPLYTSRHGAPQRPSECARHRGILIESEWRVTSDELVKEGAREKLAWRNVIRFQSIPSILQAVKLGAGISPDIPMIYALPEIRAGRLVPVMKGWSRPPLDCLLVTSSRAKALARVRLCRAWFLERITRIQAEQKKLLQEALA